MSDQPRRNLELKACCSNLEDAARRAAEAGARREWTKRQTDTYFHTPRGRLKLREQDGRPAELIAYERADEAAVRASDYRIVTVPDPNALKSALAQVLGVRVVVSKRRTLYLWENVRIHLDEVDGLGSFVEFEAVISADGPESVSAERIERLQRAMQIDRERIIEISYAEL
jgi:adenylate cyclase class 2